MTHRREAAAVERASGNLVLRRDAGAVTRLSFNRPAKLNALNAALLDELREHVIALASDVRVECVVITGEGPSFSAGHDFASIPSGEDQAERIRYEAETIDLIEALPVPTIAEIRGRCLTGALELALACDLMIASADATFADTHSRFGMVPVWGMSVRLPEKVGPGAARRLMYTAEFIDAAEALRVGLVEEVVPDDLLRERVDHIADAVTANSAQSQRIVKKLLRDVSGMSRTEGLIFERSLPYGLPGDMTTTR